MTQNSCTPLWGGGRVTQVGSAHPEACGFLPSSVQGFLKERVFKMIVFLRRHSLIWQAQAAKRAGVWACDDQQWERKSCSLKASLSSLTRTPSGPQGLQLVSLCPQRGLPPPGSKHHPKASSRKPDGLSSHRLPGNLDSSQKPPLPASQESERPSLAAPATPGNIP